MLRRLLRLLLLLLVLLAVVPGALAVCGGMLPAGQRAAVSADFRQPPAALADVEASVAWRSGVTSIERGPDRDGKPVWVVWVEPTEGGTLLTIVEDGQIHNPLSRALARLVFGYHATLHTYLDGLARHFHEDGVVREWIPF